MELTAGGTTYSFLADGNNYRMPSGDLAAWKQTSPDGWTTEYKKMDGKLLSTDTWKLSSDAIISPSPAAAPNRTGIRLPTRNNMCGPQARAG